MIHENIAHKDYDEAMIRLREISEKYASLLKIRIDFAADHTQSKIIRDFVGSIFDAHKVLAPWKGRFILITDELINNAIEHGSDIGDLDTCIIEAGKRSDGSFSISLEVHDTGRGKNANTVKDMLHLKESRMGDEKNGVYMKKRGRGLFHITEKLVDRLEFTESPKGGLAVKIEKNIPAVLI